MRSWRFAMEFPEARIIVLTTYVGDVQAKRAMKTGAQGYVLKNLLHKELLETIRAVYRGRKAMAAEVAADVAKHTGEELLTPKGDRSAAADRGREREQRDRCAALRYGRNGQEPGEEYSTMRQARRK